MTPAKPSIGFIGLGIMGLPMARHLCQAGYSVTVYNRTPARIEQAKTFGARPAASPALAAESSDILITMLTNPAAVRAVMEGPEGAYTKAKKGLHWLQMSTVDVDSTLAFGRQAAEHGTVYVDCPVTGSQKQVEAAELILLAGASAQTLHTVRPVLECLGKTIVHAGPVGSGSALKLCMNLIVAQMTTALAESVALAQASQIDPALIFKVIDASPALKCGYYKIKETAFLKRDFSPAFSLDNMAKDVGFMVNQASGHGLQLPVTRAVLALLQQAQKDGHGAEDLSAILKSLI